MIKYLLRILNANNRDYGYKYGQNESIVVQAYAGDLLIFADTREILDNLLKATDDFMRYPKIILNPSKCKIIINNPNCHAVSGLFIPDKQT
jgi:hypothetical protein